MTCFALHAMKNPGLIWRWDELIHWGIQDFEGSSFKEMQNCLGCFNLPHLAPTKCSDFVMVFHRKKVFYSIIDDIRFRASSCHSKCEKNSSKTGKARRLGPYQIREGSLPPVKDGSIDRVFHSQVEHIPVEEPVTSGQAEGPVVAELVDSSSKGIEPEELASEMVVKRKMTVDRFLPRGQLTSQQQAPSPPTPHRGKRPQDTFKSTECPSDVPSGTLPTLTTAPLYFMDGSNEAVSLRLKWYTIAAAQLAHILEERLKSTVEGVEKERAFKEVSEANLQDRGTTLEATKRKVAEAEKARAMVEQRAVDLEGKLEEVEIRLVEAKSVVSAKDKEVVDLTKAMVESEDKFYDMGFAGVENSTERIMFESQRYGFGEGWMATVNTLGVPKDSHFRDQEKNTLP
nr:hypothetical protein CFP56_67871 [Quercus suber]